MNYANIQKADIANGIGCRTTLFVSGCTHHCKGCFNKIAWDFNYGSLFTEAVQDELLEELAKPYNDGLTVLGGEPMEVINQKALRPFLERVKRELPEKTIWIYSGYTWDELNDEHDKRCHSEDTSPILHLINILVDGRFEIDKRDITLRFRGSSNQRVIDVPASLKTGIGVLSEYGNK